MKKLLIIPALLLLLGGGCGLVNIEDKNLDLMNRCVENEGRIILDCESVSINCKE